MSDLLTRADTVLRRRSWKTGSAVRHLFAIIAIFGASYGAAMGSYGGFTGERPWQIVYAAMKVPLMLLATFSICLPSFYVVNALLGLRQDFAAGLYALLATQAGLSIILASLAPLTVVWYFSCDDHNAAIVFNAAMFAIATFSAQWILRAYYRPLIARSQRHSWMLRTWVVLYSFIGIQMGWVLRPFVGEPNRPVELLRAEAWSNAYVVVFKLLNETLGRVRW